MKAQTKSVRVLPDDGGELIITPNGQDNGQGVSLGVIAADPGEIQGGGLTLKLDQESTDALVAAIYEAQGKRYRPGRSSAQVEG